MSNDIVSLLLEIKERNKLNVDDDLIKKCYELQKKYQFDRERDTFRQMQDLVEDNITKI